MAMLSHERGGDKFFLLGGPHDSHKAVYGTPCVLGESQEIHPPVVIKDVYSKPETKPSNTGPYMNVQLAYAAARAIGTPVDILCTAKGSAFASPLQNKKHHI
nr:hypothetical protein CFP56_02814 [Quercus suber]